MRTAALSALLTVAVLGAGFAGVPSHTTASPTDESTTPLTTGTPVGEENRTSNATLLTRQELFASVVDGNERDYTASLYFVAANGTWYHANPNGTVGTMAPHGNVIPNVDVALDNGTRVNQTVDVSRSNRPIYVWKVTRSGCGTTVYDASNGETVSVLAVPGCGSPAKSELTPSPTPTETTPTPTRTARTPTQTTQITTPTETPPEMVNGTGSGFGIGIAVVTVFVAVALRRR